MITLDAILLRFPALRPDELQRWLVAGHIRVDGLLFTDFDAERIRLILEMRELFEVNDTTLPLVLSLIDQVYALRRRLTSG